MSLFDVFGIPNPSSKEAVPADRGAFYKPSLSLEYGNKQTGRAFFHLTWHFSLSQPVFASSDSQKKKKGAPYSTHDHVCSLALL